MSWWDLAGCAGSALAPDRPPPARADPPVVVVMTTSDGVRLEADFRAGDPGAPAVLLLHMTPAGGFRRTDWPAALLDSLTERRWNALVVDRRGAGNSGGVGEEAFRGPGGRLDVVACLQWLSARGVERVVIVGASNGTTSMIDYAAQPVSGLAAVVGLGFLSPGAYTENQTAMIAVPETAAFYAFPESESAWPDAVEATHRPLELFRRYAGDAHGTKLFGPHPELTTDLVDWLVDVLDG